MWMGEPSVLVGDLGTTLAGQGDLSVGHTNTITGNGVSSCDNVFMCCSPPVGISDGQSFPIATTPLQINSVQSLALSSQNIHNGQLGLNHTPYVLETMHPQNMFPREPYLNIIIQPTNRIRYRYRSEKGSHGGLTGKTSNASRKTYPTVRLENYRSNRQVFIKGSLYSNEQEPKPHVHKLMGRKCNDDGICIIDVGEDMTAVFQNLGILFAGKKEVPQILYQRKMEELRLLNDPHLSLTESEKQRIHEDSHKEAKNMNLNSVKICFEAVAYNPEADLYEPICPLVFSDPVANQKSPDFGELKISRIDKCSGVCTGDDEVFLLCEKVNKKEIKVRFYELDNNGTVIWEAYGRFNETDVHHQVAIVFRTPAYKNTDIKNAVKVYLQLFRMKDGECSEAKEFHYKPIDHDKDCIEQKRKKPNYNPGFEGFGNPSNQFGPGSYPTGPSDMGNGDDRMQGFFGQSPPGYQRQAIFKEQQSSDNIEEKEKTPKSPNYEDMLTKLNFGLDKEIDLVRNEILQRICKLEDCVNKSLKDLIQLQSCSKDKLEVPQGEDKFVALLSSCHSNISRFINEYSSNVSDLLAQLRISTQPFCDSVLVNLLCQKKIQETVKNVTRTLAKKDAENLQYYAATGDPRELLVEKNHLLAVGNDDGDTPLHLALLHQPENISLHQLFLDVISDDRNVINEVNNLHQTCLHLAIRINSKIIPDLLQRGANPNIQDRHGNTAIHLAVELNNVAVLSQLLYIKNYYAYENNYPKLSVLNYCGQSPLHLAVIRGHEVCVQKLCQSGADINQQEGTRGRSALHLSVEYNNPHILNILVKQEYVNINLQDYAGNTALHLASSLKCKNSILTLMKADSNPNMRNYDTYISFNDESNTDDANEDSDECDDDDDDIDSDGKTAFDLAEGNKEILSILEGNFTETMDSSEDPCIESKRSPKYRKLSYDDSDNGIDMEDKKFESQPLSDSGYISSEITIFDEKTVNQMCGLLDPPSEDWKKLAMFLGVDQDICCDKETSPTRIMLEHLQRHGNKSIFITAAEAAQLTELLAIVRKIPECS